MLARIRGIWYAEAEVKVKCLQQSFLEEVPLNHTKVFHVLISHLKFDTERREREIRYELISICMSTKFTQNKMSVGINKNDNSRK